MGVIIGRVSMPAQEDHQDSTRKAWHVTTFLVRNAKDIRLNDTKQLEAVMKNQNGSRLGEHRSKMRFESWILLGLLVIGLVFLFVLDAKAEVSYPGFIKKDVAACRAVGVTDQSKDMVNLYILLNKKLDEGTLTDAERMQGMLLSMVPCGITAALSSVYILDQTEGYTLFRFDEEFEYSEMIFITKSENIILDQNQAL